MKCSLKSKYYGIFGYDLFFVWNSKNIKKKKKIYFLIFDLIMKNIKKKSNIIKIL